MAVRIDRNRSLPIPYRPASPVSPGTTPEEAIRAIWDEFTRISTALIDLDRPMSLSVRSTSDTITVGATATYSVMIDTNVVKDWEVPGAAFNAATGIYTCPSEGLFLVTATVVSNPFAAPATKSYSVLGRVTQTRSAGGTAVYPFAGGGLDDQFVTASHTLLIAMAQGDTLQLTAAGVHATKTGTNVVTPYLNVIRQSGIGDAN